jgi:tetratricopeptide (TPR) repeat protein
VTAAIEAARAIGVDAVLCGQVVSYNVVDDLQTDHHVELGGSSSKNAKTGESSSGVGFGLDSTQTLTREASVSLAVKLIDVRTGELRAARQFAHTFHGQRVNGQGELPTREAILTKLLNECSQDAIRMIAPHYVPQQVTLARQYYGKGLSDVRAGNKLAVQGKWPDAVRHWEAAVRENPQNHAAEFNLAVAAEARQDFPAARQHVEAAIKSYAATEYQKAKARINRGEQQYQAALAQAQSRATAIAARQSQPTMIAPAAAWQR